MPCLVLHIALPILTLAENADRGDIEVLKGPLGLQIWQHMQRNFELFISGEVPETSSCSIHDDDLDAVPDEVADGDGVADAGGYDDDDDGEVGHLFDD